MIHFESFILGAFCMGLLVMLACIFFMLRAPNRKHRGGQVRVKNAPDIKTQQHIPRPPPRDMPLKGPPNSPSGQAKAKD